MATAASARIERTTSPTRRDRRAGGVEGVGLVRAPTVGGSVGHRGLSPGVVTPDAGRIDELDVVEMSTGRPDGTRRSEAGRAALVGGVGSIEGITGGRGMSIGCAGRAG